VWVEEMNMRAAPGASDEVVAVLAEGSRVDRKTSKGDEADGYYWARVRADYKEGWLADKFIVPAEIYLATREADKLGRSGNAAAMVAELKRVATQRGRAEDVTVSPDGKKVLCRIPASIYDDTAGTDLYFVAGRGLVDKAGESLFLGSVKWSADGRYFVRGGNFVAMYPFRIYDAEQGEAIFGGESYRDNFAFVDGYFVFLTTEPSDVVADADLPAMYYVPLPGGKMRKLLEADAADARERDGPREYRLRPVGEAPPAVAASALYLKYVDDYAPSYVPEE